MLPIRTASGLPFGTAAHTRPICTTIRLRENTSSLGFSERSRDSVCADCPCYLVLGGCWCHGSELLPGASDCPPELPPASWPPGESF